jgi:hypothetical protein
MNKKELEMARQRVVNLRHQMDKMIEDFGPESKVTEAELLVTINRYRQARSTLKQLKKPSFERNQ